MNKKNLILLLSFLLISVKLYSQDTTTLLQRIKTVPDTEKVDIYNQLGWMYRKTNPESGIKYLYKSLEIADSIKYFYGKCLAYNYLGVNYRNIGYYSTAILFYKDGLNIAIKHNFTNQIAFGYNNLGNLYYFLNLYKKALTNLHKADSVAKIISKSDKEEAYRIKGYVYNNIGQVYLSLKNTDSAIYYARKSLENWKKTKYTEKFGVEYRLLANAFLQKNDLSKCRIFLDSTQKYFKINTDVIFKAEFYRIFGEYFFKSGKIDSALTYLNMAQNFSESVNAKAELLKILKLKSEIYESVDKFQSAYYELLKAYENRKEIFSKELEDNINSLEFADEQLQKRAEIKILQKNLELKQIQNKRQKDIITGIVIIIILISISFFIVLILLKKLKKYNNILEEKNKQINEKNEELSRQKDELLAQQQQLVEQKELILAHDRMLQDNIKYASSIQQALLPVLQNIGKYFENFVIYWPRDIISGDFYWFSDKNEKYLYFALGDCTGHGVTGAMLSVVAMYLFKNVIEEKKVEEPVEILNNINRQLNLFLHKTSTKNIDGFDVALVRFEKNNYRKIIFSGAKSSILIYLPSKDELIKYRGVRRSVGNSLLKQTTLKIKFEQTEISIDENSTIYFFTDGFIDQNSTEGRRYGSQRFQNLIRSIVNLPLAEQKSFVISELKNFMQNIYQRDDISIVALRRKI